MRALPAPKSSELSWPAARSRDSVAAPPSRRSRQVTAGRVQIDLQLGGTAAAVVPQGDSHGVAVDRGLRHHLRSVRGPGPEQLTMQLGRTHQDRGGTTDDVQRRRPSPGQISGGKSAGRLVAGAPGQHDCQPHGKYSPSHGAHHGRRFPPDRTIKPSVRHDLNGP